MCRILLSAYLVNNQDLDSGNRIILSWSVFKLANIICVYFIFILF